MFKWALEAASNRFACVLLQVDNELCVCYNNLVNTLSIVSFFQMQHLVARNDTTTQDVIVAAYKEDVAAFEKNLISIAGGVKELGINLQQHMQELQGVWPQLQDMGVQLTQLTSQLVGKVDEVAATVEDIHGAVKDIPQYFEDLKSWMRQGGPDQGRKAVLQRIPEMVIAREKVKSFDACLGKGSYGAVFSAKYENARVAVKAFYMDGATPEEMDKVRELAYFGSLSYRRITTP